jgi:cell division protein FtsZ
VPKNVLLLIVGSNEIMPLTEIAKSTTTSNRKQATNANIIKGVGEDDTLGDSIAVTIIAGFNVEQQNEIVNTEPKKLSIPSGWRLQN